MVLCGVCIGSFTLCVFLDVVTRTIGHPWLWLQQATTAFFAWGVFIGIAVAIRRHDHIYLAEITKRMTGNKRWAIETFDRRVVPISGILVMLFCVEQIINGWQKGFEGPEDDEFLPELVE